MLTRRPFYVLLLGAYPVLALWAANLVDVTARDVWRALAVSLVAVLLLLWLGRRLLGDWTRAAWLTTGLTLAFFTYGHVYAWFLTLTGVGHRYLLPVWLLLWGALLVGTLRRRLRLEGLTLFLNTVALVALLGPLFAIGRFALQAAAAPPTPAPAATPTDAPPSSLPDIYYIILDGYGRADRLQAFYDYDNQPFLQSLTDQGFYIASDSRSNYPFTYLSLLSSLNYAHLTELSARLGVDSNVRLYHWLEDSQARRFLVERGYQTVAISSGYTATEFTHFDHYYATYARALNPFETRLLNNSLAVIWGRHSYAAQRERILFAFQKLAQMPALPGPKFVFMHVLAPHPPFVFGPHGEARTPGGVYDTHDASLYVGTSAEYRQGYRDQLHYINQLVGSALTRLIADSPIPPVIVVQGDHGPGSMFDLYSAASSCLAERYSILNAYYLPGHADRLYPGITPVNTFRLIFDAYLGADLPLLPDASYFAPYDRPYDLQAVTAEAQTPGPRCQPPTDIAP